MSLARLKEFLDSKVSVEPTRVMVVGAKQKATAAHSDYPNRTFRLIELPTAVNAEAAAIVFESGVVKLELFKVHTSTVK